MTDYDWEQRIALLAYYKWENAGRPEGQDDKFWFEAVEEYRQIMQEGGGEGSGPHPALGD